MEDHFRTRLILFGGVLGVTSSAFIIRAAVQMPYILAATRVLLTGIISFFLLNRNYTLDFDRKYGRNIIVAGFSLATHFGWWFESLDYLNVGTSLSLTNTAPVWMALFLYLIFGTKLKFRQLISIGFVILGSGLLFFNSVGLSTNKYGLLLAIGSAIGFAIYLISARQTVPILGLWKYFGLVNLSAALFLYLWCIQNGQITQISDSRLWIFGLLLAIIPGTLGHAVYNWAIPRLDTIDVGIATLGEPVLGTIIAWFLLSEFLEYGELAGVVFLIMAIGFTIDRSKSNLENNYNGNSTLP